MRHEMRWTLEKLAQRLDLIAPLVYRQHLPLGPLHCRLLARPEDFQMVDVELDEEWDVVESGDYWGAARAHFVLRGTLMLPRDWPADVPCALYLPLGDPRDFSHPEALILVDGIVSGTCDRHHREFDLAPWRDGRTHLLTLEGWIGQLREPGAQLRMGPCALVQIDTPTREFLALARVTLGAVRALDAADPARARLLTGLDAAFQALDLREPFGAAFYASVPRAHTLLGEHVAGCGQPLDVEVVAAGHAHLDVAWLWTLAVTRRKARHTFRNVLRLMQDFPDFHFTQSQPQLYDYIRQDEPELFAAIRERVAQGRWEPIGGMWVEADCNVSGGESLARQFLLGRAFFREHFGPRAEAPVLWLPDVFGYAWNLPQLIKQAGLDYFFTIKIGWNQYNRLPYDTFWWQGLDGTRVLTHFSTTAEPDSAYGSTYNAQATPEELRGTWTNFKQKELTQPLLMCFGYGDGGGGPTREMLENLDLLAEFPALPRARQGRVRDFFRQVEAEVGDELPVWNGELYLEIHRGTYTTQARNKRANRQSEFLLHDAEFLAALAALVEPDYRYPAALLGRAWELVCLNQFHDILPGSSIGPVYAESLRQYAEVRELAGAARESALAVLAARVGGDLLLVNPTAFPRRDLAHWPGALAAGKTLARADGTPVATQPAADGGVWLDAGELPPYSVTPLVWGDVPAPARAPLTATPVLLENAFLRVEFAASGDITRIYDKANAREVLPTGAVANQFLAFEDRPLNWDAWDIDIFYDDKVWLADPAADIVVDEAGPLRAALRVRRRILSSDIEQRIALSHDSPRLDFETVIHWRERHILLKVAFPVDVLAPTATYEIQWGNVTRPTHRNTSWDWARFETCAQKWVDLSEGGYGVSLLNDGKYGHDIHANVIRLSLLRSPTSPDPEADQGEQRVTYSLFPHAGGWDERTVAAAYALNDPLIVAPGSGAAARAVESLLAVDAPHVVIETVKRAENGQGLIVRLYESQRRRGPVTLTAGFPLAQVWRTNLLEQNQEALDVAGREVTLDIKPYEIVTLRLVGA